MIGAWLARAALILLALTASYGVYEFQRSFTPKWVALLSAAAFESVYIALSMTPRINARRASIIAAGAVGVSVVYNTLAALFARRPDLLDSPPLWADAILATLHGAPLAVLAYNVALLTIHATPATLETRDDASVASDATLETRDKTSVASHATLAIHDETHVQIAQHSLTLRAAARALGVSPSTLSRRLRQLAREEDAKRETS